MITGKDNKRLCYLDNLRIFLMMLVICHHQAIAFGAPGGWYYIVRESADMLSTVALVIFVGVNQAFFMSLLFFIAAYFTPISLDGKGTRRFIRDRLIRLGIPLLVFFFLLNPAIMYLTAYFRREIQVGFPAFMLYHSLQYTGWGPLWFVLTLLIFTSVYLLAVCVHHANTALTWPGNMKVLAFVLGIGLFTFLLRIINPLGNNLFGLQVAYFPLYIAFFIFGIQAHRGSWLSSLHGRQATLWFRIALVLIVLLPVILVVGGALRGQAYAFRGGLTAQSLVYSLWEPFLCVGISMKLLVLFRHRFNKHSTVTSHLSKSTYTAYIIHPFFVVTATYFARNWPLPPLIILLILCPVVIVVCFAAANVLRQLPGLKRVV